jgi:hypothetical protein
MLIIDHSEEDGKGMGHVHLQVEEYLVVPSRGSAGYISS